MKLTKIGRGFLSVVTLGLSLGSVKDTVQVKKDKPTDTLPTQGSISENSIYLYYLTSTQDFGTIKPPIEIVLRNASLIDRLTKNLGLGTITFTDSKTLHTLTLNTKGDIHSFNNGNGDIVLQNN